MSPTVFSVKMTISPLSLFPLFLSVSGIIFVSPSAIIPTPQMSDCRVTRSVIIISLIIKLFTHHRHSNREGLIPQNETEETVT